MKKTLLIGGIWKIQEGPCFILKNNWVPRLVIFVRLTAWRAWCCDQAKHPNDKIHEHDVPSNPQGQQNLDTQNGLEKVTGTLQEMASFWYQIVRWALEKVINGTLQEMAIFGIKSLDFWSVDLFFFWLTFFYGL